MLDPKGANKEEPSITEEYIYEREDAGKVLAVFFNGPTELKDVLVSTKAADRFKLEVSQDGKAFTKYDKVRGGRV